MLSYRFACVLLLMMPAMVLAQATTPPASQPATRQATEPSTRPEGVFLGYTDGKPVVEKLTTGFHKMIYQWVEDGHKRQVPFSLFLPSGYGKDDKRWPMLTFMPGLGDRGDNPDFGMGVGVPAAIGRDPELLKAVPMIVLTPQCPSDVIWDSAVMSKRVIALVHAAVDRFAADPARLYVTGFSDGGKGAWVMAAAEPNLFAVTAPIVAREYHAEQTANLFAGTGITCLVISGLADDVSEPASSHMVAALRKQEVDVVYVPIPNANHFVWQAFYERKEFYDWLLKHSKGQSPPKDRLGGDDFLKLYAAHEAASVGRQIHDSAMQRNLDRFEPYWFIDNCGDAGPVGLRNRLGRGMVMVTLPFNKEIPCRLQTTRQLPKDKLTDLEIEVGHPPKGQWELVIRLNEQEKLRTLVNDETAADGWLPVKLSLADYAGDEVRIQLVHYASTAEGLHTAYWSKIKLTEKPKP